jgi:hypothetical protein
MLVAVAVPVRTAMPFVNGHSATYTGEVCQWQNGVYEVLAPADKVTSAPIYPKPLW